MLYVIPVPVGAVIVIVPVATVQEGWSVTLAVGAAGDAGTVFTVTLVPVDIHPDVFFAVTLYVPGLTRVNTPVVLV
jgi:hypothetical protein